jgi:hypothetical protein
MILDEKHEPVLPASVSDIAEVNDEEQDASARLKKLAVALEEARATIAGLQQQKEPTTPESVILRK